MEKLNKNKNEKNNPFGHTTTAELMLEFGKSVDEALNIHNAVEKLARGEDVNNEEI